MIGPVVMESRWSALLRWYYRSYAGLCTLTWLMRKEVYV